MEANLICPTCGHFPSKPKDKACPDPHHMQQVETQEIAGLLYPVCRTCGPSEGYTQAGGQSLQCQGCGQGFPGWFYGGPLRIVS